MKATRQYLTLSAADQSDVPEGATATASRFWSKVDRSGGPAACWPWTAYRNSLGYGRFAAGWTAYAHREAARLVFGDFDPKLDVCHHCDNPPCCNPAHLFIGTHRDNFRDASDKGRLIGRRGELSPHARLTWPKVHEIRRAYAAGEASERELGKRFGVSQVAIHFVVTRKTWDKLPPEQAEAVA